LVKVHKEIREYTDDAHGACGWIYGEIGKKWQEKLGVFGREMQGEKKIHKKISKNY